MKSWPKRPDFDGLSPLDEVGAFSAGNHKNDDHDDYDDQYDYYMLIMTIIIMMMMIMMMIMMCMFVCPYFCVGYDGYGYPRARCL